MIFCCRAHHRRPANVDVLDGVFEGAIRFGDGFAERVQIHDDQINRFDAMRRHGLEMFGQIAATENAAMNFRV